MDSCEEPFTRSPWGLGVTALTIIPAMHTINITVWNWTDTRISEDMQQAWDRPQVVTEFWSEKPYMKKHLGRSRNRGEENIKLNFQEI
jgi:hypothetical protein